MAILEETPDTNAALCRSIQRAIETIQRFNPSYLETNVEFTELFRVDETLWGIVGDAARAGQPL